MGIMSEWKAFAALAVEYLGMPLEVMPLYSAEKKWKNKAEKICAFIMEVGNFGHNRDMDSRNNSYVIKKLKSLRLRTKDSFRHFFIFPKNSIIIWLHVLVTGVKVVVKR